LLDLCRKLKLRALKIFTVLHQIFKRRLNPATFCSTSQENDCFIMTVDFSNCTVVFDKHNKAQLESVFICKISLLNDI